MKLRYEWLGGGTSSMYGIPTIDSKGEKQYTWVVEYHHNSTAYKFAFSGECWKRYNMNLEESKALAEFLTEMSSKPNNGERHYFSEIEPCKGCGDPAPDEPGWCLACRAEGLHEPEGG